MQVERGLGGGRWSVQAQVAATPLRTVWLAGGVVVALEPGAPLWCVAASVALIIQHANAQPPSLPLLLDLGLDLRFKTG